MKNPKFTQIVIDRGQSFPLYALGEDGQVYHWIFDGVQDSSTYGRWIWKRLENPPDLPDAT